MKQRFCKRCNVYRPVSAFNKSKRGRDGLSFYCTEHERERMRQYRHTVLEEVKDCKGCGVPFMGVPKRLFHSDECKRKFYAVKWNRINRAVYRKENSLEAEQLDLLPPKTKKGKCTCHRYNRCSECRRAELARATRAGELPAYLSNKIDPAVYQICLAVRTSAGDD